jgi:cob(I)alamin adenosyltransferase
VSAALARLALAEAAYNAVSGAFDANNLDEVKRLAKEARKLAHFAREDDLHDAEEIAEDVAKVSKRIAQVKKKLAELKALGGDTTSLEAMIAEVEKMFAEAKSLIASGGTDALSGFAGLEAAERRAKIIKNTVENAIFALGGEDDDFDDDHRSEVADFVKSLDDVADIEGGGIGKQVRTIARAQKLSADKVATLIEDAQGRSAIAEFLIGPKTDDLDEIQNEILANNVRIEILNRAIAQVTDADIKAILSEQVAALQQETTKLTSFVDSQLDKSSLFGWLSVFFPKF